jgi:nucleoside-diphosphate-sugar epimerase
MAASRMTGRIVVLGGAGQFGREAALAFRAAGWQVASQVRGSSAAGAAPGTEIIEVDARDSESVIAAARGADVVLHALNVPYTDWARFALPFADTAIAAARDNDATLVFPGNLYNFGRHMPGIIDEITPMRPTSRKGAIRVEIEARLRRAAENGTRVIVLRAGDFFGVDGSGHGSGSWFDRAIIRQIGSGQLTYPGPLDVVHEWAYVPDLAQALVRLVEARADLPPFASFGFAGHAVTGHEFTAAIARACRRKFKVDGMPWRMLKTLGLVVPVFRELSEIAYLWSTPHVIDRARLTGVIGEMPQTPLDQAIVAALAAVGLKRQPGQTR